MELKKAYYYIICLAAAFILAWGIVDLSSSIAGLFTNRVPSVSTLSTSPSSPDKESEPYMETYYQKKMLYDRLWDSLARIVVAGVIFAYSRSKVDRV